MKAIILAGELGTRRIPASPETERFQVVRESVKYGAKEVLFIFESEGLQTWGG